MPTTHRSDKPCRTNAAGPGRNPPPPIDTPSTITPGPTACSQPNPVGRGGSGNVAGDHGGNPDRVSMRGVGSLASDGRMDNAHRTRSLLLTSSRRCTLAPMDTRPIGSTGLHGFPLCLGGNVFGWTIDEAESFAVLDAYAAAGGNFIDTADTYSSWVPGHVGGESETIIGRWMRSRGNRERMIIATKVGLLS